MNKKYLLVILVVAISGIGYNSLNMTTFGKELTFYTEYIKHNEASGNHGIWTFEEFNWTQTMETHECRFQEVPFRELRNIVDLWKAPIIRYDINENVIWTFVIYPDDQWVCYWSV